MRASAAIAGLVSLSGCLVVSPPEYESPPQTPPYLIAAAAFPNLWQPVCINSEVEWKAFGAAILSEDNGVPVKIALYFDYGQRDTAGLPYRNVSLPQRYPAGTIADGQRPFERQWFLDSPAVPPGCHTLTMVASHEFDDTNLCPADPKDMSTLTWQIILNDSNDTSCSISCPEPECATGPCPSCADFAAGTEAR